MFFFSYFAMCIPSIPCSPVSGTSIHPDPIVASDEESGFVDVPAADELSGSVVDVDPLDLTNYRYKEICMHVEQTADPKFLLRDVQQNHGRELEASMRSYELHYRHGMITVAWLLDFNARATFKEEAFVFENYRKGVKSGFKLNMLDGRHRCAAVRVFKEKDGNA